MSWEAVRDVIERYPEPGSRRIVLIVIAEHANGRTGICYPSIKRIAALAQLSERQVKRCIQELDTERVIEVRRVRGRGNVYRVRRDVIGTFPLLCSDADEAEADFAQAFSDSDMPVESDVHNPAIPVDNPVDNENARGHLRQVKGTSATGQGDIAVAPEPERTRKKKIKSNGEYETRFARSDFQLLRSGTKSLVEQWSL